MSWEDMGGGYELRRYGRGLWVEKIGEGAMSWEDRRRLGVENTGWGYELRIQDEARRWEYRGEG